MSSVAITICILSLVASLGLWLGNIKIRGVGLGIGGVLFGGIIISHIMNLPTVASFMQQKNIVLDSQTLYFVQEFGLILFVYTIGIQVGPGFFASLRSSGLKLNAFAALIVLLGGLCSVILYYLFSIPLPAILGILSGAVTNTPSLGAGKQIIAELGGEQMTELMGMGYAIAYPFGIIGVLLAMWLIRLIFKIRPERELQFFDKEQQRQKGLAGINIRITNPNINNILLREIPDYDLNTVIYSRLKRNDELIIPHPNTTLYLNDILHLVGNKKSLNKMQIILGEEAGHEPLNSGDSPIKNERAVVTNEQVCGKKLAQLQIQSQYDVVISRINRAGVELIPSDEMALQFGDVLHLVGRQKNIATVLSLIGNAQQKLQQVQMLPVFIGIGLGVLLGSIPIYLPGFPVALKLGLAGGPLVVALVLARIGSIGKLYWFMPPSANLALREIGIVLFLSVIGIHAGEHFFSTLLSKDGFSWICYGAIITLLPLLIAGIIARYYSKMNYLTICGLLAGAMTDTPALAFANAIQENNGASVLAYATVYPLTTFLRIMLPQLIAVLLWAAH